MKILSLFLLTLFFGANLLFAQNNIQTALATFVNDPTLKHASVSFHLIDLETNKTVASNNSQLILPTASTAKLFSTATAIEVLGPNFRPETRLYIDGAIDSNGVLNGNLWVRGGGDPALGSKYFNSEDNLTSFFSTWVKKIKDAGIKTISGSVIADASEFGYNGAPGGWNWDDLGNYYGAGPSGLTIYDNMVRLKFKTSATANQPTTLVSMQPTVPGLVIHNYVLSSKKRGDNSYIYGAPYSMDRFATGTLPINQSEFLVKGSLPDPEMQVAYEFTQFLQANSIGIKGEVKSARRMEISSSEGDYSARQLIYTHKGPKLIDIIKITNHKSVNLFAEHMVSLVAYHKTGDGSTEKGLEIMEALWATRINAAEIHLNDGSGLSRSNAISAKNFTSLLAYMNKSKNKDAFFNSLPISGESGTLKYVCRNQSGHGKIHAKSGTMTRIKSYAGYIHSTSGKKYAFAIVVNNQEGSTRNVKKKMEVLFNKIATF